MTHLAPSSLAASPSSIGSIGRGQHCVGCPGQAREMLAGLLGESTAACAFDSVSLEAREALPAQWGSRYGFALVRRGYLIRHRTDAAGHSTSVDVVGPGCVFPLPGRSADDHTLGGYAVTRALVCLCVPGRIEDALRQGGETAVDLQRLYGETIERMERLVDARGRAGASGKVAALLCTLADTMRPGTAEGAAQPLPSEFLQRDLASLLSIRHESVCRVMRDFSKQGLIERGPDGTRILDRARLEAL